MIQLFLKYNPLKFILVFLVLVFIRGAAYKMSIPITDPEIIWNLVGERMAKGFVLYKEIWTSLEPFSAAVYCFIYLVFGKSSNAYFVLSLLLVFIQSILLTRGLNKNRVFKEPSTLPALFYILFSSIFFDFYTLSPVLLGTTFVLWAFTLICFQLRATVTEERVFYIGLLTGLASLFYLPLALFLLFALFSLGIYANTTLKHQMTIVLAFFFPHILLLIYYFWIDNLGNYYHYALYPTFHSATNFMIDFPTIVKIVVLPLILLLAASMAIATRAKYIHYQFVIIKVVGFWLLTGLIAIWFERAITPHLLILFVPALSFFTAHLFVLFSKNKISSELSFFTLFGGVLLISFYSLRKPDSYTKAHLIKSIPQEMVLLDIKDKKLLVLGDKKEFYINNSISGNCVEWPLSSWLFEDFTKYENTSTIYEIVETNKPDYIIDQEKKMEEISSLIPLLKKQYQRIDSTDIYRRKS